MEKDGRKRVSFFFFNILLLEHFKFYIFRLNFFFSSFCVCVTYRMFMICCCYVCATSCSFLSPFIYSRFLSILTPCITFLRFNLKSR